MPPRRRKTKGTDVPEQVLTGLLDAHVALATCKPKLLWKLDRINTAGHSSEWATIKKHAQFLSELLDATNGRIPHQKSTVPQLDAWLRGKGRGQPTLS